MADVANATFMCFYSLVVERQVVAFISYKRVLAIESLMQVFKATRGNF